MVQQVLTGFADAPQRVADVVTPRSPRYGDFALARDLAVER
jgi:hypothetical protein